jgi:uncharacterized protein
MPVTPTYPGVYIEEIPSGVRTISGVATSIGMFIGRTASGEMDTPTRCLSYAEFLRNFTDDATQSDLPRQVKLFFDNGGGQCFVVRIAKNAAAAAITLRSEIGGTGADVLVLTARSAGKLGNDVRAAVNYNTPTPEASFNLELFRWARDASGTLVRQALESHSNLSMNPQSARYAPKYITQNSALVTAVAGAGAPAVTPPAGDGYSLSGRPLPSTGFNAAWDAIVNPAGRHEIRVNVDGTGFVTVDFGTSNGLGSEGAVATAIKGAIDAKLVGRTVAVDFVDGPGAAATQQRYLRIGSNTADGDVVVQPSSDPAKDVANALMLGTGVGGIEVGRFASYRPAATGVTFTLLTATAGELTSLTEFADRQQGSITGIVIAGTTVTFNLITTVTGDPMYKHFNGSSDGVREKLGLIATAINNKALADRSFTWRAEVWGTRLAIIPTGGSDSAVPTVTFVAGAPAIVGTLFLGNVRYDSLGTGVGGRQITPVLGSDGNAPDAASYAATYLKIDKDVDLFNLLILPRDNGPTATDRRQLWGDASLFCQKRRAFLIMDPPDDWTDYNKTVDNAVGVSTLRTGLVKDHAAVFFPRLKIFDGAGTLDVDPAGAIGGLMARIDGERGVWKAPAGTEADLRGIAGVKLNLSNDENGVLNQRAVNTIRVMPVGVVNWGARTMDGDDDFGSEWKYVPVRRVALYLEESIYRGIQWAVFEPNDEPLWAQIRLNVGSFMHSLFRQGAFQGKTPNEAYLVKCDKDTTTQDDINRGIVNVLVGFAPLKPAEFVIVKIQQLAGQLAV